MDSTSSCRNRHAFRTLLRADGRFTFEIAASLGVKPVILEHPDSWSRSLVDEGLAAKFIPAGRPLDL